MDSFVDSMSWIKFDSLINFVNFSHVSFLNIVDRDDGVVSNESVLFFNNCFIDVSVDSPLNIIRDILDCWMVDRL